METSRPPATSGFPSSGSTSRGRCVPQQWINIVGTVWDPDAMSTLSYTLNGGPSSPLTIGPDGLRLAREGDYNIEIDQADLSAGANQIVITALDSLGEQSDTTVTLNFTDGVVWALPDTADWSSASQISDVAQVVDGQWILTGGGVRTDSSATGYDRLVVMGDYRWLTDYEVVLPITVHANNLGGSAGMGMAIGWQGHTGNEQPRQGFNYQMISWIVGFPGNPKLQTLRNDGQVQSEVSKTLETDVRYRMKVRSLSLGNGMSQVSTKLWEDGTSEPGWDLVDNFVTRNGSVLLISHFSEVTFGDVSVTPVTLLPQQHTITTNTVGSGSVVRLPDLTPYPEGTTLELTAVPDSGWAFVGWSGGLSGTENPDTILVVSDSTVTATFAQETYVLTTNVIGNGTVTKFPDQPTYLYGDTVVVTALPDSGFVFDGWSDGLSGTENPDTVVVLSDTTVTATFTEDNYVLTTNVVGNGTVTKSPDQSTYLHGDTVLVTAVPDTGWTFVGWSEGLQSTENPDTVVMMGDTSIVANFDVVTGIDPAQRVTVLTVRQNFPNPFTQSTQIQYGLPRTSDVHIEVYDVGGRRVFVDHLRQSSAGWNRYSFEGTDATGKQLPTGVYFYRIKTVDGVRTKKMVIMR
jgi:uncharacterized repeat protein (TIGR02543 family)